MASKSHLIGWMALLLFLEVVPICAQGQAPPIDNAPTDLGKSGPEHPVYRVGDGVSPPRAINTPDPEYSERARKAGYGGTCVLWLEVDAKGAPRNIKVTHALGLGLDEKAMEAVRQWKFAPAMKDGVPVAVMINVEVSFHIDNEDQLRKLFEKADAGNVKAQFEVSQVFLSENDAYDDARGLPYLEKAARQGFPKAQFEIGRYLSSRGNDVVGAYVWYSLAERNHFKDSGKKLKELAEKMTPDELAEGRRRANGDHPLHEAKPQIP
jgi:TonB family protein